MPSRSWTRSGPNGPRCSGFCGAGIPAYLAARTPARVSHLALFHPYAFNDAESAEPWLRDYDEWIHATARSDKSPELVDDVRYLLPSLTDDPSFRRWWQQAGQRGASPRMAAAQYRVAYELDLRPLLPTIHVPTLVLCRTDAVLGALEDSRELANLIAGARLVELPGDDYYPFAGDADAVADEIEEFLTGSRAPRRGATGAHHDLLLRHRRVHAAGHPARRPGVAHPPRPPRCCDAPTVRTLRRP